MKKFGSLKKVHRAAVSESLRSMRKWTKFLRKELAAGNCNEAFKSLLFLERAAQKYHTEKVHSGLYQRAKGAKTTGSSKALKNFENRFHWKCILKRG